MTVVRFSFPDNPGVIATPIYRTLAATFVQATTPIVIPLDDSGVGFANMAAGVYRMDVDVLEYVQVPSTALVVEYSTLPRLDLTDSDISIIEGTPGPQGLQGPTGQVGPPGVQGESGIAGPQGVQGAQGGTGPQGVTGVKGDTGATGPQGVQGVPGTTGLVIGTTAGTIAEGNDPRLTRNFLNVGEETFDRLTTNGNGTMSTQVLRLTYFTARKTETITSLRVTTGATAAAATPTLIRFGVYVVDASDNLTLVASTVNDVTLLTVATTSYTKALAAFWNKIAGQRYAIGSLVVTAVAAPTLLGNILGSASELGRSPRVCGNIGATADLPASIIAAVVTDTSVCPYVAMIP